MLKKHILIVSPLLPYPSDSGTKQRIFQIIKHINLSGMQVSLIICDSSLNENQAILKHLLDLCLNIYIVPPSKMKQKTSKIKRVWDRLFGSPIPDNPILKEILYKKIIEWSPDFIQVEKTSIASLLDFNKINQLGIPIVLEEGGVHHISYEREAKISKNILSYLRNLRRAKRLKRFESSLLGKVNAVTAVSVDEAEILKSLNPKVYVLLVPNGVDSSIFNEESKDVSERKNVLFFCGSLSYLPNADVIRYFLKDILPELIKVQVDINFVIAGGDIPKDIIKSAKNNSNIKLLGFVPDISKHFKEYKIMLNPMRLGGGTRLKLLEAMAYGMACISTTVGAEGINVEDKKNILLTDSPKSIALAIKKLATDSELANNIGLSARDFVKENYLWSDCVKNLIKYYKQKKCS